MMKGLKFKDLEHVVVIGRLCEPRSLQEIMSISKKLKVEWSGVGQNFELSCAPN